FRHPPPLARCPGHHDEKVRYRAWGAFDHAAAGTACRRSLPLFPGAANGDLVHCLPLHHGHVVRSLRHRGHQGAERRGWPHRPQCGHRVRRIFDCARSQSAGGTGSRHPRDRAGRVSGKRRSAAHIPPEGAARRFAHGVTCRLRALALAAGVIVASPCGRAAAQQPRPVPATPDTARTDSSTMPGMRMPMSGDTTKPMPGMRAGGHDMSHGMNGPLGLSHVRMGSGTSWMPDSSPMHAAHRTWDGLTVMLHGVAFGQYDDQGSMRGDHQLGIVDWEMLMAMRRIGAGQLHLHAMVSLEPLTLGAKGYPLLLQTGESYRGQPLHDRQHPHDAIMELAAMFQQPVSHGVALEFYGGVAGEPALGPVAFMHRPSAQSDPLAPLGHHWQDATHISFGVVTAGIYSRAVKLEGSVFNGRE